MKRVIFFLLSVLVLCSCSQEKSVDLKKDSALATTVQENVVPRESYEKINSKGSGWGLVRKKGSPPQITIEDRNVCKSMMHST